MHRREASVAENYMDKVMSLVGWRELFYSDGIIPQNVTCDIARYRWKYGSVMLSNTLDYESALEYLKDGEYISKQRCPEDLFVKGNLYRYIGQIYLRLNELTKSYKYFTEAISAVEIVLGEAAVASNKMHRSEVNIRLGNLQEAYEDAIFFKTVNEMPSSRSVSLQIGQAIYNAAFAQYKLNNYQKSIEHFAEFVERSQSFCKSFLEKGEYDELIKQNAFDIIPYSEKTASEAIKTYLHNAIKIFTAIYDKEHTFVKDYIEKNYLEAAK